MGCPPEIVTWQCKITTFPVGVGSSNGCIVILVFRGCFYLPTVNFGRRVHHSEFPQFSLVLVLFQQNMSNETQVAPHLKSCLLLHPTCPNFHWNFAKNKQGGQCCTWACWPPPSPTGFKPLGSSLKSKTWQDVTDQYGVPTIGWGRCWGNYFGLEFSTNSESLVIFWWCETGNIWKYNCMVLLHLTYMNIHTYIHTYIYIFACLLYC